MFPTSHPPRSLEPYLPLCLLACFSLVFSASPTLSTVSRTASPTQFPTWPSYLSAPLQICLPLVSQLNVQHFVACFHFVSPCVFDSLCRIPCLPLWLPHFDFHQVVVSRLLPFPQYQAVFQLSPSCVWTVSLRLYHHSQVVSACFHVCDLPVSLCLGFEFETDAECSANER